jgi:hypothetical protein
MTTGEPLQLTLKKMNAVMDEMDSLHRTRTSVILRNSGWRRSTDRSKSQA